MTDAWCAQSCRGKLLLSTLRSSRAAAHAAARRWEQRRDNPLRPGWRLVQVTVQQTVLQER